VSDKELRTQVLAFLAGIILFGLAYASLPYWQYRAFVSDCADTYTVVECKQLWRMGNE